MSAPVSHAITRKSASNLALAFVLLPRPQRTDMAALYAFCREVDDVADEDAIPVAERRVRLAAWREDVRKACNGRTPEYAVNRELQPAIQRCQLPFQLFDELIQGCEMDLESHRYADWPQLDLYCHRVASVVGLLSIEIFGYRNASCRDYAIALGKAFQITNILRDVHNDAARGRIYLPQDELERFGVGPGEILAGTFTDRFRQLASAVALRARAFYSEARAALPPEDRRSMIAAELMGAVYWRLLQQIEASDFNVLRPERVRVSKPAKLWLVFRTWWRLRVGPFQAGYGVS